MEDEAPKAKLNILNINQYTTRRDTLPGSGGGPQKEGSAPENKRNRAGAHFFRSMRS